MTELQPEVQSPPAAMPTEQPLDIAELAVALAAASAEVKAVPKSGWNNFDKYKYSTDADVAMATRGPMAKHGLALIPVKIEVEAKAAQSNKGNSMTWYTVRRRYLLIHSSGQSLHIDGVGTAMDRGDKGLYKAETGCLKYILKTLFNLACGEDPETGSPEGRPNGPPGAKQDTSRTRKKATKTAKKGSANEAPKAATGDPWKDAAPEEKGQKVGETAINALHKIAEGNGVENLDGALTQLLTCTAVDLTQGRSYQAVHHLLKSGEMAKALKRSNAA